MTDHSNAAETAKLPYAKPTLTDAGAVADLTFGGSGQFDFGDSPNYLAANVS